MQDNFEKKVQGKLDGLKLEPSAPVWEKITLQIRPEKKRRRVLFFLFLLALLLGGWWFGIRHTNGVNRPLVQQQKPLDPTMQKQNKNAESSPATKASVDAGVAATSFSPLKEKPLQITSIQETGKSSKQKSIVYGRKTSPLIVAKEEQYDPSSRNVAPQQENPAPSVVAEERKEKPNSVISDSGKNNQPTNKAAATVQPAADSLQAKKKIASADGKWAKEVLLQAGWSGYATGIFSVNKAFADALNYNNYPPPGSSSGQYYGPPAPTLKGPSFSLGFGVSRNISKHFSLAAAVQYSFYSTRGKVGAFRRIDTAMLYASTRVDVAGYYANGQQRDYTNRFHFIEIPVSARYEVSGKLPLQIAGGVVYGRLLSGNALSYNTAANVYYFNKQNNRAGNLSLFASLQYRLVRGHKWKFGAGPLLQYSVSSLQKESPRPAHLFFAGLKTAFSFDE